MKDQSFIFSAIAILGMVSTPSHAVNQYDKSDNTDYKYCVSFDTRTSTLANTIYNSCPFSVSVAIYYNNGQSGLEFVGPNGTQSAPKWSQFGGVDGYGVCRYPATPRRSADRKFRCD